MNPIKAPKLVLFLALWSTLVLVPTLWSQGPNVVTRTFLEGAHRFAERQSPYQSPGGGTDGFHYAPFFAWLVQLFSFLLMGGLLLAQRKRSR